MTTVVQLAWRRGQQDAWPDHADRLTAHSDSVSTCPEESWSKLVMTTIVVNILDAMSKLSGVKVRSNESQSREKYESR